MMLFEGLKVLDVGTWIAGPVSATIMADFGADVIKVEIPGTGDPYRGLPDGMGTPDADINYTWVMDGRNKRSVTLNLKTDEGKAVLHRLIRDCDVYVTNQPMAVRRSLGLTWDELSHLNDRMIFASLTAYGEKGPEADKEGFDGVAYWTRSGLADLVRAGGSPPGASVAGMGDHPTAVSLFACIMMGLYQRQITGKGCRVATSLLANGFWANGCMGSAALAKGDFTSFRATRYGNVPWTRRFYETADDRLLQLYMVRTHQEQEQFLRAVGLGEMLGDERFDTPRHRFENSDELFQILTPILKTRAAIDWIEELLERGINLSRVQTVDDMLHDQQAIANDVITPPTEDLGTPYVINPPLFVDGIDRVGPKRAPDVGEHTREVLASLGYEQDLIDRMARDGII